MSTKGSTEVKDSGSAGEDREASTIAEGKPPESYERPEPLFDEEPVVTEDDLKGVEKPEKPEESSSSEDDDKSSGTEKEKTATSQPKDDETQGTADDESRSEEKSPEAKADDEGTGSTKKPPAGYVPLAALHEERSRRKELAEEIRELRQQVTELTSGKRKGAEDGDGSGSNVVDDMEGFKVLSDEEFDELVEEDPQEALRYQSRLRRYEQAQRAEEERRRQLDDLVKTSVQAVAEAIPGFYEDDGEVAEKLSAFASQHGFGGAFSAYMTDPRTLVMPPGADEPVLLGEGAANLLKMIHSLHQAVGTADPEKLRAEVEKEVTAKVTKELMEKFKKDPTGVSFRDIGEIPGAGDKTPPVSGPLTEAEYARMSADERRAVLGG